MELILRYAENREHLMNLVNQITVADVACCLPLDN
jgi:hypothetical protein